MQQDSKYSEYSYKITGACYEVMHQLGCGFLESVYKKALSIELHERGFFVEEEKAICISYKGVDMGLSFYADLVVDGKVIVELKAVKEFSNAHRAQLLNYLKSTGLEFGMLVNFGTTRVEIERFANGIQNKQTYNEV